MSRDFRTTVYIPQDLLWLARYKFSDFNLSDFTRKALMALVSDGQPIETPLSRMVNEAVSQIRADLLAQQKITEDTEAQQKAAREYLETRQNAIREASITALMRVRDFEKYLPDNDINGDYAEALDQILIRVSKISGYDVDLQDLVRAYREIQAGVDVS